MSLKGQNIFSGLGALRVNFESLEKSNGRLGGSLLLLYKIDMATLSFACFTFCQHSTTKIVHFFNCFALNKHSDVNISRIYFWYCKYTYLGQIKE